jgi:hypothetical protein
LTKTQTRGNAPATATQPRFGNEGLAAASPSPDMS